MRATLSHPNRRFLHGVPLLRLFVPLAATGLSMGMLACNEVEADESRKANAGRAVATSQEPFSWPEDPSHPVLEISVETPSRSGTIQIELMPELAPATVVQVIELANSGYYDGTTFHRVIPDFMIQGGDPNSRDRDPSNDGYGDPTIKFHDEFGPAPFERGVVGMGNTGRPDSSSSQFFIMQSDAKSLDGRYTAIGRVISGLELVDEIMQVPTDRSGRWGPKDRPIENVEMKKVQTIGQVAQVRAALQGKAAGGKADELAAEGPGPGTATTVAESGSPPASLGAGEDWERLEIDGR